MLHAPLRLLLAAAFLAMAGCATPPGRGPTAMEAMQRLPPVVGSFARLPVTSARGANDDARQVAGTAYLQIAGTTMVTVLVPNAPDPGAAAGPNGPGMAQAMERAILAARLGVAREGGTLAVRHQLNVLRNGEPMLRCWVTQVAFPAPAVVPPPASGRRAAPVENPQPPGSAAPHLRAACVGLVVDRFINLMGTLPDTPEDMQAVANLGIQLVQVLRNPASPVTTELRPLATPQAPPVTDPQGEPLPTPPGTRRGRAYSF